MFFPAHNRKLHPFLLIGLFCLALILLPEMIMSADSTEKARGTTFNDVNSSGTASDNPKTAGEVCFSDCSWHKSICSYLGDPIAANNGIYYFDLRLLSLGGLMDLDFTLYYRSEHSHSAWWYLNGFPQTFWWHPMEYLFYEADSIVTCQIGNGDVISFVAENGSWAPTPMIDPWGNHDDNKYPYTWELKETENYFFLMDPIKEQVHIFWKATDSLARIFRIEDRNGNHLTYAYADDDDINPIRVDDGMGRFLEFTYQENQGETTLVKVTDHVQREIIFTHEAQGADNNDFWTVRSVTNALNQTTTFYYTTVSQSAFWSNLISRIERPKGNSPYTMTYELKTLNGSEMPRVVAQEDAYGNTTQWDFDQNTNLITENRPDGAALSYEHFSNHGLVKSMADPNGKTVTYGRDNENNRITSYTNRNSDTASCTYHPSGKLESLTDFLGRTKNFIYEPQEQDFTAPVKDETVTFAFYNLIEIQDFDGTTELYVHDERGNIITYTDQAGNIWEATYNSRGQLETYTNPNGGQLVNTYNADGTPASSTDSDTGVTTYSYDAAKRFNSITYPDGNSISITLDANNNLTSMTDEAGNTTTYAYDANGNPIQTTTPSGHSVTTSYDDMEWPTGMTDTLGNESTQTYDGMGRIASIDDAGGDTMTAAYDFNGRLETVFDSDGKSYGVNYDDDGWATDFIDPMGNIFQMQRDEFGNIISLSDPSGNAITFTYDSKNRITSATNQLLQTTTYEYDERGHLASITTPGIGTVAYEMNEFGLMSKLTDLNNSEWLIEYTSMGRLSATEDPLGNRWEFTYNASGRIQNIAYPTGETRTITYDNRGFVVRNLYSDGTDIQNTYNNNNMVESSNNISVTYDFEGQITNTSNEGVNYGASYNSVGGLQTVTYHNSTFQVDYQYDAAQRLTRVSDTLTGAQVDFEYDDNGRLNRMMRSNGVNMDMFWNETSRLTRIQDGNIMDFQYTYDAAGNIIQEDRNPIPLDPEEFQDAGIYSFSVDAASQINSTGYSYDARGRLTSSPNYNFDWDGAARLVGVNDVSLEYNGFDDLIRRTEGGETVRYFYNLAVTSTPIMAIQNTTKTEETHYFVWTPEGQLLYMIDASEGNKVYFYHFDQLGSTIALTDQTGAVTDAYAYDAYGRLLAHEGNNSQPFTFLGHHGVRQEGLNGDVYQMRVRYYDARIGRFISRDPSWPQFESPRSINPYSYAASNPVTFFDASGQKPEYTVTIYTRPMYVFGKTARSYHSFACHHMEMFFEPNEEAKKMGMKAFIINISGTNIKPKGAKTKYAQVFTKTGDQTWSDRQETLVKSYKMWWYYYSGNKKKSTFKLRADEALAMKRMYEIGQVFFYYNIPQAQVCQYCIYCWQCHAVMKVFLKIYKGYFHWVKEQIEKMKLCPSRYQANKEAIIKKIVAKLMKILKKRYNKAIKEEWKYSKVALAAQEELITIAVRYVLENRVQWK